MAIITLCRCGATCRPGRRACPRHERKDTRASAAVRGYDARWRKTRAAYLRVHPKCECHECLALPEDQRPDADDVHHLDGQGPNGPYGHEWANLAALTHEHHSRITATEQPAGSANRAPYYSTPFVILCGLSGTGKSTILEQLAQRLDARPLARDDYETWAHLLEHLDQTRHAVVECVRIHSALRRRVRERGATIIELTAPTWLLRERLTRRGEPGEVVRSRLAEADAPIGYEDDLVADHRFETGEIDPDELADRIAAAVSE